MAYTIKRRRKMVKNKKLRSRSRKRYKKGGHEREDVPHYHLFVKTPKGKTYELNVLHAKTSPAPLDKSDIGVNAVTIGILKQVIYDKTDYEAKDITLFWKGKALLDNNLKLRKIVVDGEKLPLYMPNNKDPIIIKLNTDLDLSNLDNVDIDLVDEDTP
jgi:hypothetical protein